MPLSWLGVAPAELGSLRGDPVPFAAGCRAWARETSKTDETSPEREVPAPGASRAGLQAGHRPYTRAHTHRHASWSEARGPPHATGAEGVMHTRGPGPDTATQGDGTPQPASLGVLGGGWVLGTWGGGAQRWEVGRTLSGGSWQLPHPFTGAAH